MSKVRYTLVFEWDEEKAPRLSAMTTFEGGQCVKVQFSDALAELEQLEEIIQAVQRYKP